MLTILNSFCCTFTAIVEAVQALVELGANVNAPNNMTGATPLHMVAQSRKAGAEARLKVIDILLGAGAATDQADNYGSLPVHAVQLSSSSGPGVVSSDDDEALDEQTRRFVAKLQPRRPDIFVAIVDRDPSKLQQLLANDSSLASSNIAFQGDTPVRYTVDELLEVVSAKNEFKDDEVEALIEMLKLLLNNGADANGGMDQDQSKTIDTAVTLTEEAKEPPLHKVVCTLREFYKKAETKTSELSSALATLVNVIEILMDAGATLTPETPLLLHQAARFNEFPFARCLIESLHVDPNTKGRQGMTPLQFAARSGQMEMLVSSVCARALGASRWFIVHTIDLMVRSASLFAKRFLLEQPDIDVNAKDNRGNTALDAARVNKKEEAVRLLEEYA
jgi:ankyrin repeat protein